jgi:hypothetical protein
MGEVATIAMTVSAFKTRHLFQHKFRSTSGDAPPSTSEEEEPAPAPGGT